jgi:hypothetical protein
MRLLLAGLVIVPAFAREPLSDAAMRKDFLTWRFGMFIHFNTDPAEVCDTIGPGWFWTHNEDSESLMTVEESVKMVKLCNRRVVKINDSEKNKVLG